MTLIHTSNVINQDTDECAIWHQVVMSAAEIEEALTNNIILSVVSPNRVGMFTTAVISDNHKLVHIRDNEYIKLKETT